MFILTLPLCTLTPRESLALTPVFFFVSLPIVLPLRSHPEFSCPFDSLYTYLFSTRLPTSGLPGSDVYDDL